MSTTVTPDFLALPEANGEALITELHPVDLPQARAASSLRFDHRPPI